MAKIYTCINDEIELQKEEGGWFCPKCGCHTVSPEEDGMNATEIPMTVRELRQLLFNIKDQDAKIVLSCDSEGNGFGHIREVEVEDGLVFLFPTDWQTQNIAEL